jgi:gliding motility-associated-like protein
MQSLGQDIRFLDRLGNSLAYWIEDGTINSSSTTLWVKVDSIKNYSKDTIYMYYGNASATAMSNARSTFHLIDEFNGSTLSSTWSSCGSGSVTVSAGKLQLTTSSNTASISTASTLASPLIVELFGVSSTGGETQLGWLNTSGDGYAITHDGSSVEMKSITNSSCITASGLGGAATISATGDWSFVWNSNQQKAVVNGTSVNTTSSLYTPSSLSNLIIANQGSSGSLSIDQIRARRYIVNAPTVSVGTEQDMNFTISAYYSTPLCAGGTLKLGVNTVSGAKYSWSGPNGFKSQLQSPEVTGVSISDAGRYDLTVELPSGCASKSTSVNVNISPKAVGGTVSGTQTVCSGSNSGILSLSGHTGNVIRWDSSAGASGPWFSINNTGLNQSYVDLTASTYYRAIVANGNCSVDSSSAVKITVTPPSTGGQITGVDTVCATSNSGMLTLTGQTGNVIRWESSLNGNLWTSINNKGTTQGYNDLKQTTYYRAAVRNGNCDIAYSSVGGVTVDLPSLGGTSAGATSVCPDVNQGWITLSGHRGHVLRWEWSDLGGSIWHTISGTKDSLEYNDIKTSRNFRAVVRNGECGAEVSTQTAITVLAKSNGGLLTGGTEVCETGNSGKLSLSATVGTIEKWQSKTIGGSWTDITSSATTLSWLNLIDTTDYRVIVSNQGCSNDTSNIATILVNPRTEGGYIDGLKAICEDEKSVSLSSKGRSGKVLEWQSSYTGFSPWTSISSTSDQLQAQNLTGKTYFRTKVKSGVCAVQYSDVKTVDVHLLSDAGQIKENIKVCEGTNYGSLKVQGYRGQVEKWIYGSDANGPWTEEPGSSDRFEVQNVSNNVYAKAVVRNGVCKADTSTTGIVEVSKYSKPGDVYGAAQWCEPLNTGTVEVKNHQGDVLFWEFSENNGANWTKSVTNSSTFDYTNLAGTTAFRATIQNGVCPQVQTQMVIVELASASEAGQIKATQSLVCEKENEVIITVENSTADQLIWQTGRDGNWSNVTGSSNNIKQINLSASTQYRLIARNEFCEADTSDVVTIMVSKRSIGGEIIGDAFACQNMGQNQLVLQNHLGEVQAWEFAEDVNGPWIQLAHTAPFLSLDNSGKTSYYRVLVKNGACPVETSGTFRHTVYEPTLPGKISGDDNVCEVNNNGILELKGYVGDVVDWEMEDDNGQWKSINFNGDLYWFENLSKTTSYRARIKNGTCEEEVTESIKVAVHPNPRLDYITKDLCEDHVSTITDNSTITQGVISAVRWEVSDGFTSNEESFRKEFTLPGRYLLQHSAVSDEGCITEATEEIIIGETPQTLFRVLNGVTRSSGCLGTTVSFEELTAFSDKTGLNYYWDFGNNTTSNVASPTVVYDKPGTYTITLTAEARDKCSNTYSFDYQVLEEIKPIAGNDVTASLGIGTQLSAKGSISYSWSPAGKLSDPEIPNPIATVTESTLFVVTGTDYYGCESKDSVWVFVEDDYTVIPNNVITPDGNNENDVWVVQNLENYPNNNVSVFDRWGREVFRTKGYRNDWGATNEQGGLLLDGTYYYVLEFPETGKVMKGAITVVRNK